MKKFLVLFFSFGGLALFGASLITVSGWSDGLLAGAIVVMLIALRFAAPEPNINFKK